MEIKNVLQQFITAITADSLRANPLGIAKFSAKPKSLRILTSK